MLGSAIVEVMKRPISESRDSNGSDTDPNMSNAFHGILHEEPRPFQREPGNGGGITQMSTSIGDPIVEIFNSLLCGH